MQLPKTQKENNEQFKELCDYVKNEIMRYDDTKQFPRTLVLRLKGLSQGSYMASKDKEQLYSYKFIENVFKCLKSEIIRVVDSVEIKNEQHLINLIFKIVNDNFNDIVEKVKQKQKNEIKLEKSLENLQDNGIFCGELVYNNSNKKRVNKKFLE